MNKWESAFSSYSKAKSEFQVKTQVLFLVPALIRQISMIFLTIYYLHLMNMRFITIEEFVFINGSMWILVNHINKLVSIVTYELKEDIEKVGKYYEFMSGLTETDEKNDNISSKNPCFKKIELKNISYTYPDQAQAALHNFNLSINKGHMMS